MLRSCRVFAVVAVALLSVAVVVAQPGSSVGAPRASVAQIAYSPDGSMVATADDSAEVWLYLSQSMTPIGVLKGHTAKVSAAAFSPDGMLLASAGEDKVVRIWDVTSRTQTGALSGHTAKVMSVAFSPDGRLIASGSSDRTARLWDLAKRSELAVLKGHTGGVTAAAFSPDGRLLVSASADKTIRLWQADGWTELAALTGHTKGVSTAAFSPDGRMVASGAEDSAVRLWDVSIRQPVATLEAHTDHVHTVAWSSDSKLVASGSDDWTVRLWDVSQGREDAVLYGHGAEVRSVAFSPDGTTIASAGALADGALRLWDAASRAQIKRSMIRQGGELSMASFHSPALEGNLIGDPATRRYGVYLPPSYDTSDKRYPVIYLLPGLGLDFRGYMGLGSVADRLIAGGETGEVIAVFVDGLNRFTGTFYLGSTTIGDYEGYVAQDIVRHVDLTYRTLAHKSSRAITGHSAGAIGAMHLGLRYPDIFGVVLAQGGVYSFDFLVPRTLATASSDPQDWAELQRLGEPTVSGYGLAAIAAPNPNKPPFYLDKLAELVDGVPQLIPALWQKLLDLDPMHDVEKYVSQPLRLNAIMFTHGNADDVVPVEEARRLDRKLKDLGVPHTYVEYEGGHFPLVDEAIKFPAQYLSFGSSPEEEVTAVEDGNVSHIPPRFALQANYPNPFNSSTLIAFTLPARIEASLAVCDMLGRAVRTLVQGLQEGGVHAVAWDGRDDEGRDVATGVYFSRLELPGGGAAQTRRMLLLR